MDNKKRRGENRREYMRVHSRLHFCVSVIESIDEETGTHFYGDCFCSFTQDISLGGMCISHGGKLNTGFSVEITIPEKMRRQECLTCEYAYLHKNGLELTPIYGEVMWVEAGMCGIKFNHLNRRNENILSKFIWEEHLNSVRDNKENAILHKKF